MSGTTSLLLFQARLSQLAVNLKAVGFSSATINKPATTHFPCGSFLTTGRH